MHRGIILASVLTVAPTMAWLIAEGTPQAAIALVVVVFAVVAYSAPKLRFKERPFLDSFTSAVHFAGPLMYALVLTGAGLTARGAVAHLGRVPRVGHGEPRVRRGPGRARRPRGRHRVDRHRHGGTRHHVVRARHVRGRERSAAGAAVAGLLAAVLPLAYVASVARFARITDDTCEDANAGWRTFLWLNQPVGFLVTMLLIVSANGWL